MHSAWARPRVATPSYVFFDLAMFHVAIIAMFGMIYYFAPSVRALPPWLRVHPIAFLPMAVLMPVAYLLLTPLLARPRSRDGASETECSASRGM